MEGFTTVTVESDGNIARVTLNRPERRNAIDAVMGTELREVFEELAREQVLRAVLLAAKGEVFCAGADIKWMQSTAPISETQARDDAQRLTSMFRAIDECPCPVIGLVQGPAFGGGVGLMAACDMVVAAEDATFALSETRLGLIPAIIAPLLLRKAGESFLRRYCLTGDTFTASTASTFGLVHDVVPPNDLEDSAAELIDTILRLAPQAVRESKALIRRMLCLSDEDRRAMCADTNAQARCASEAREGLQAFLEKRLPSWAKQQAAQHTQETQRSRDVAAGHT
ncbi:MAG: Methylglutaconyl-CoA hydratase [Nitrospira sp.]|jgi:methylglutaconyl-CoA hydratase|nr:MAG: Methylglutaconyl-CoA hydratase [Nitrospira sp.]